MANLHGVPRKFWRALLTGGIVALFLSLLLPPGAWARPTTAVQARRLAATWLSLDPRPLEAVMGQQVKEVQAFPEGAGEPLYFIVYLNPQGFIVVPADDLVEPIIAFVPGGLYDPSPDTPLGALVNRDVPGRVAAVRQREARALMEGLEYSPAGAQEKARRKWELLESSGAAPLEELDASLPIVSEVWVDPFVQSQWGQGNEGAYCYNYYTPSHYVCGCVATYMAQLMRYHTYPTVGVGTPTFNIYVDGALVPNVPLQGGDGLGGPYDWSNMVLDPDASTPDGPRQAIGALTSDAGISVNMSYRSSSSGASFRVSMISLVNTFKYSNTIRGYNSGANIPLDSLFPMINPNLDARLPVPLSIRRPGGGHGILADGYGYDTGTIYHHLNMGWSGSKDAWYNLPDISIPEWGRYYDTIDEAGYNIYPSGTGEIISGRVTTAGGSPIDGAAVAATRTGGGVYYAPTDNRGVYALAKVPPASTYTVQVTKTGYTFTPRTVSTGTSVTDTLTVGNVWGVNFVGAGGPQNSLAPVYQLLLLD